MGRLFLLIVLAVVAVWLIRRALLHASRAKQGDGAGRQAIRPGRPREVRALRHAPAARRGASGGRPRLLQRRARPPRAGPRLMDAPVRYPELFTPPRERVPESFWISLGYFNLYRIALATLFLTITLIYGDALNLGSHSLGLFRTVCAAYLVLGIVFQVVLRTREQFNVQLTLHAGARRARHHHDDVRERRHAQRPGRDAADLADRRGDRRADAPVLPLRGAGDDRAAARAGLLGAGARPARRRTSCSPASSPSAASPARASPAGWRSASRPTSAWRGSAGASWRRRCASTSS